MKKVLVILLIPLLFVRCNGDDEGISVPAGPGGSSPSVSVHPPVVVKETPKAIRPDLSETVTISRPARRNTVLRSEKPNEKVRTGKRIPDTILLKRLIRLKKQGKEPDLREPVSRDYLLSRVENPQFSSMITLSRERSIRINFDNDILDNTDRYYTNGIRFDYTSPFLKQFPLSWLMIPYWGSGINAYGLSIAQNMYTPFTTKTGGIHRGDRPYAAYLIVGSFKITVDPDRRFRQTTELDLGIIGPSSYGDFVQKSFHTSVPTNNEPLGWEYQIRDDLVANYHLIYEKGIVTRTKLEFNLITFGSVGTLYTHTGGGYYFRTGWFRSYFTPGVTERNPEVPATKKSPFQLYFFQKSTIKAVGYDATLEGGMFNRSSIYTLNPSEISRFVYQGSAGITLSYGGLKLDVEQFVLSPEFSACQWHKWIHIGITVGI